MKRRLLFIVTTVFLLFSSFHVYASESDTDTDNDYRLNALEIRLQDYEYTMSELRDSIQELQDNDEAVYQEKLALQQQLDLLIVGFDELLNMYIAMTESNVQLEEVYAERYDSLFAELSTMNTSLSDLSLLIDASFTEFKDISVSGNELITIMNDNLGDGIKEGTEQMLTELNSTLAITNKFLSYLSVLLILLFTVFLAVFIGKLLHNTLFRHID